MNPSVRLTSGSLGSLMAQMVAMALKSITAPMKVPIRGQPTASTIGMTSAAPKKVPMTAKLIRQPVRIVRSW